MGRYVILVAAFAMQMCLGATYSWAVFVAPLKQLAGIGQAAAQLPFTLFYIAFPATTILAGATMRRFGPRGCAMGGGAIFGLGWMFAGLGAAHFGFTILGIGALGGIGVGLAYVVPIATCVLWFPEHKGLVTGIAVAGFGGGAALVSQVAHHLMEGAGLTPFAAFRVIGLAAFLLIPLAGFFMRRPAGSEAAARVVVRASEIVTQPLFRILYFAMFAGLMAGFAVNANLKELRASTAAQAGVNAVGLFAIGNALGRIVWGALFDRIRSRTAIAANLLAQAALLFGASWLLRAPAGLETFAALAGFNYGGVLVIYASATAREWGAERVASIYGWLFSANALASFAPTLAGRAYEHWGSFTLPLAAIAVVMLTACAWAMASRAFPSNS
ncbi:MAG: MFS transporter [Candidatus Sumerlaeota bacterium]|nr:MFS transporter [Candidatus Sumerlaeota bacterium]